MTLPTVPPVTEATLDLTAPVSLDVVPDVGTAAWIDCAGHLPWGLSGDQRLDDERSLTWEIDPPPGPVVGHPVLRAKVWATKPAASLSVKICDVFPDGTSALVTRGTLDLAYRDGVHGSPSPLVPGREYDVEVVLDACAYQWTPGQTLRVSVAGSDWPNTVAPPEPVSFTLRTASLTLPLLDEVDFAVPVFAPGAEHSSESTDGVGWGIHHDVLHRTTTADDPVGQPLPHAVRRDRARALPGRGVGEHPDASPRRRTRTRSSTSPGPTSRSRCARA